MGQIIAQEGFTPRYLRGELLMAHEEEGTEVSLGKIEVIRPQPIA